jgi:roadblock/LC7 domain-containing protein
MANVAQTLGADQQLNENDYLSTGNYQLLFQDDGNLVVYYNPGPNQVAMWANNTSGQDAQYAIMQTDGNFVIYGSDQPPNALWATNTHGSSQCALWIYDRNPGYMIQITDPTTHLDLWREQGGPWE